MREIDISLWQNKQTNQPFSKPGFFFLPVLFLLCSATCFAQGNPSADTTQSISLEWFNVDSAYGLSGDALHVYKSTSTIDGRPNISFYVSAVLKNEKIDFSTITGEGKRYKPSEYYNSQNNPALVVNGTFFSFADNSNLNLVINEGKILSHNSPSIARKGKYTLTYFYPLKGSLGIKRDGNADIAWVYSDTARRYAYAAQTHDARLTGVYADPTLRQVRREAAKHNMRLKKWKGIQTAIAGGPVLVQNGQVAVFNEQELAFAGKGISDKHPRTAIGYTKEGRLIIMVVQGRFPGLAEGATLPQEARMLKQLGCVEGLNLDGGGSSCMLVNGKETITPCDKEGQRAVPAVFMIRQK